MTLTTRNQYMIRKNAKALKTWMKGFLRDCKVRDLSAFTIEYFRAHLAAFESFCRAHDVIQVQQITADLIRGYLLRLEAKGHNPGGRHAKCRAVRAFLLWCEREVEPEDWANPIRKLKPPKVADEPIEPVPIEDIKAMLTTCSDNFTGRRVKAIILCLLDCGARPRISRRGVRSLYLKNAPGSPSSDLQADGVIKCRPFFQNLYCL